MKKKVIPVLVAIALICVVAAVAIVPKIWERYSYSKERADLTEYFECSGDEARIMHQDELLADRALVRDGAVYFQYDTVAAYMEDRFYYNETERVLKYTLPDSVETIALDASVIMKTAPDLTGQAAAEQEMLEHTAAFEEEGTLYLWADYVQRYCGMSYALYGGGGEPYRVQIFTEEDTVNTATVKKAAAVRRLGGIKSPILTDAAAGDEVVVLNRMETWAEVKTKDCVTGYIEVKYLENEQEVQRTTGREYTEPVYPRIERDHKIVMAWHPVMSVEANSTFESVTANVSGLNVISPTWFYVTGGADGVSINNVSDASYVARAHEKGYEVWALAEDMTLSPDLYGMLSQTATREELERQLVNAALNAGVDGINIDFETVSKDCGVHFAQFLRELSILTHQNGLVLSVDNYVPEGGRGQYHLEEQGIVVDYVVLMGYDEHWAGCKEAGSVASIGFVERGIRDTIDIGVPADKIVNGVPFFTRIWCTDGGDVTSSAVGMQAAKDWAGNYGMELMWDEVTCQNYGELTSGGALYQIWLEDADSLRVKLNVMNNYQIAGVSAWRLGYETADIWAVIAAYGSS